METNIGRDWPRFEEEWFRLGRLRRSMQAIEEYALGMDTEVRPFFTDENGAFAPERMETLLSDITGRLYSLTRDRERMVELYTCLLYCVLRNLTTPRPREIPGVQRRHGEPVTFQSLLAELCPEEVEASLENLPFLHWLLILEMDRLYRCLAGDALPEDENRWRLEARLGLLSGGEGPVDAGALREEALYLRETFPRREDYLRRYERLGELLPDLFEGYDFETELRRMFGAFLLYSGCSRLGEPEPYLTVKAHLNKALRVLRDGGR